MGFFGSLPGRILPGLAHAQNIHPLVVHFPIAFLYGAALFYYVAVVRPRDSLEWTAFWMLVLGTLGAGAAVATGLYAESGVMISESVRAHVLEHHEDLMITASVMAAVLAAWAIAARPMPAKGRWFFIAGLAIMLCVITSGADLGAEMVYGYNAGGDACAQPIDFHK
ncbi:MAG: DUF2231 domain-containing protein [Candidatus Binataceae bacterium]